MLRVRPIALALFVVAQVVPAAAAAKPSPKQAKLEPPARRLTPSRSIGSPTDGHLVGGARLGDAPYLRIVPVYAQGDVRWGVESLVGAIDRAARSVRRQYPDAVLSVGHLSKPGGGDIDRHASHTSGRDADIAFFVTNERGKPVYAEHFVPFKGDGTAPTWPGARFDDARNWAFLAAMIADPNVRISHVFVSLPIRQRLLAHAAKIGAPHAVRVRASELMAQPRGALPHDDHFHVRVACPMGMDKCVEQPIAKNARRRPGHRAPSSDQATASLAPTPSPSPRVRASAKASGPAAAPVRPPPSPATDDERDTEREEESARADLSFPSLAPLVPGLDSVVIPKPLEMPKSTPARPSVVDDPDGVLDP